MRVCARARARPYAHAYIARHLAGAIAPTESWERASGEILGGGFGQGSAILSALCSGELTASATAWATELFEAIASDEICELEELLV